MPLLAILALAIPIGLALYFGATKLPIAPLVQPAFVGVSIFDNETGLPEHDRLVAGLSDLVVERLSKLDPDRLAVIGNSHSLRQPRNIRNLANLKMGLGSTMSSLASFKKARLAFASSRTSSA